MSVFLVNGKLKTDKNKIHEMWADHFEALETPSDCVAFNNVFFSHVSERVNTFTRLVLMTPLEYYVNLYSTKRLLLFVIS